MLVNKVAQGAYGTYGGIVSWVIVEEVNEEESKEWHRSRANIPLLIQEHKQACCGESFSRFLLILKDENWDLNKALQLSHEASFALLDTARKPTSAYNS
jgi:hypothetical protein